jgi:hypothetical protein
MLEGMPQIHCGAVDKAADAAQDLPGTIRSIRTTCKWK